MNGSLIQGISVMCIGMGTVVAFLCITIASMFVMSAAVKKLNQLFPEAVPAVAGGAKKTTVSNDDSEVAAAIVAALFRR